MLNGPAKSKLSLVKVWSNFAGLEVSFYHKKLSQESQILGTKEIGENVSQNKYALSWSHTKSRLDHSIPLQLYYELIEPISL